MFLMTGIAGTGLKGQHIGTLNRHESGRCVIHVPPLAPKRSPKDRTLGRQPGDARHTCHGAPRLAFPPRTPRSPNTRPSATPLSIQPDKPGPKHYRDVPCQGQGSYPSRRSAYRARPRQFPSSLSAPSASATTQLPCRCWSRLRTLNKTSFHSKACSHTTSPAPKTFRACSTSQSPKRRIKLFAPRVLARSMK